MLSLSSKHVRAFYAAVTSRLLTQPAVIYHRVSSRQYKPWQISHLFRAVRLWPQIFCENFAFLFGSILREVTLWREGVGTWSRCPPGSQGAVPPVFHQVPVLVQRPRAAAPGWFPQKYHSNSPQCRGIA